MFLYSKVIYDYKLMVDKKLIANYCTKSMTRIQSQAI